MEKRPLSFDKGSKNQISKKTAGRSAWEDITII